MIVSVKILQIFSPAFEMCNSRNLGKFSDSFLLSSFHFLLFPFLCVWSNTFLLIKLSNNNFLIARLMGGLTPKKTITGLLPWQIGLRFYIVVHLCGNDWICTTRQTFMKLELKTVLEVMAVGFVQ